MLKVILPIGILLFIMTNKPMKVTEAHASMVSVQRLNYPNYIEEYLPYIVKACNKYKMNPKVVIAVIITETHGNRYMKGLAGEQGLMQLLPQYHYKGKSLWDVEENIDAGTKYLSEIYYKYLSLEYMIRGYNSGIDSGYKNPKTIAYYNKFLKNYRSL